MKPYEVLSVSCSVDISMFTIYSRLQTTTMNKNGFECPFIVLNFLLPSVAMWFMYSLCCGSHYAFSDSLYFILQLRMIYVFIMLCFEAYFAFVLCSESNNCSLIVCCVEHLCIFWPAPTHRLLTPGILTKHPISRHHRESVITQKFGLFVSWVCQTSKPK
jgi:hypothetical protein